ncbi:MAG: hypothetical protein LHV68_10385 [Elusimicrobia bacterium]|nr:hypothetical protein [Candidatus Liberimonas magnetica]
MQIHTLIKPLGIIAYSLVFITALSGLLRWKLKYHKFLAFSAIILATIHFIIVVIANS